MAEADPLFRAMDSERTLNWFCKTAFWEGISYILLLFIAMPLKYWADMPLAVRIVGGAHGALFVLYVALLAWVALQRSWDLKRAVLYFLASLVPFATFWVERDARR